jgi:hypothetical protein
MAQLKKTGAAGGTDFFEMNLPHCLLANVVKTEMEAVGSHIQVKNLCTLPTCHYLHTILKKCALYTVIKDFTIPFYLGSKARI